VEESWICFSRALFLLRQQVSDSVGMFD